MLNLGTVRVGAGLATLGTGVHHGDRDVPVDLLGRGDLSEALVTAGEPDGSIPVDISREANRQCDDIAGRVAGLAGILLDHPVEEEGVAGEAAFLLELDEHDVLPCQDLLVQAGFDRELGLQSVTHCLAGGRTGVEVLHEVGQAVHLTLRVRVGTRLADELAPVDDEADLTRLPAGSGELLASRQERTVAGLGGHVGTEAGVAQPPHDVLDALEPCLDLLVLLLERLDTLLEVGQASVLLLVLGGLRLDHLLGLVGLLGELGGDHLALGAGHDVEPTLRCEADGGCEGDDGSHTGELPDEVGRAARCVRPPAEECRRPEHPEEGAPDLRDLPLEAVVEHNGHERRTERPPGRTGAASGEHRDGGTDHQRDDDSEPPAGEDPEQ